MVSPPVAPTERIGNVVIRNSERSLVKPRMAIAETARFDENVKVPSIDVAPLTGANGASFKNAAIWWPAGIVVVFEPKLLPLESVKKNEIVAAPVFGLAIAMPVFTAPATSANTRPDWINGEAGTDVSETTIPRC